MGTFAVSIGMLSVIEVPDGSPLPVTDKVIEKS